MPVCGASDSGPLPNLIPHLLPINPPVEVAAVLAVRKAMEDTGSEGRDWHYVHFPCPSKVTYVKSPLGTEKSEIDQVLAIKDVCIPSCWPV